MNPTLRPATLDDLTWLEPFYESLMRPLVELTHEWSPTQFRDTFNPALTSIIQLDGQDIGLFKVDRQSTCWSLLDIQIAPAHQNRGIGTTLIKELLTQATTHNLPVQLRVLKGNPAIYLYQKLGFTPIPSSLTNSIQMRWQP